MALGERSARWPWRDGQPPHLPMPDPVPETFLLPGDPARVDLAGEVLEDFRLIGQRREFRMAVGRFGGRPIGVCSTGIGGASTEIAVIELTALGARTVIRVGGMGALADDLALGSFVVVTAAIANSRIARFYAPGTSAVLADREVAAALEDARRALNLAGRCGLVATADGYYRAQGRPDHPAGAGHPETLDAIRRRGADGVEMECEVVLAVASALHVRAGAILAVHAHRGNNGWLEDYEETQRNLIRAGAMAASALA